MNTNRRNFLKMMGVAGFCNVAPFLSGQAAAEPKKFLHTKGPILMTLFMNGGHDDTSFSNPIGNPTINSWAGKKAVGKAGNIRYAPLGDNKAFFERHYQKILAINGMDIETSSHNITGTYRLTGHQEALKNPYINELYAAIAAPQIPLPYMTNSIPAARSNLGIMPVAGIPSKRLLATFADINQDSLATPSHMETILKYQNERLQTQRQRTDNLPRWQNKLNELNIARNGASQLKNILEYLDQPIDSTDLTGEGRYTIRQYNMFLIAAAAGFTATGAFRVRHNYDTHADNDKRHTEHLLPHLTRDIDYIWDKAEKLGIANRLILFVTSDVGRGHYARPDGKDHWSYSSDMIMAKGKNWTNRIVGASNYAHRAEKIDPTTLKVDSAGAVIQPRHVHYALRELLGIHEHELVKKYPVYANEHFPIFDGSLSTGLPKYLS